MCHRQAGRLNCSPHVQKAPFLFIATECPPPASATKSPISICGNLSWNTSRYSISNTELSCPIVSPCPECAVIFNSKSMIVPCCYIYPVTTCSNLSGNKPRYCIPKAKCAKAIFTPCPECAICLYCNSISSSSRKKPS